MSSGKTDRPIVFFGTEPFSLTGTILSALIDNGYNIAAVVTKPDSRQGRGHKLTPPAIKDTAKRHGIPVWQPTKLADIADDIRALQPVTGVLVSYGRIIPQSIIDLFTPGIINVHPSLLPQYRGSSPVEAAISGRDGRTGVSLMQLVAEMDAGPVYAQAMYALDQHETRPELYDTLGQISANLLTTHLPAIIDNSLQPVAQDDDAATYCQLLSKADSLIDPATTTPGDAEARIRAHLGFPRSRIALPGDTTVIVTRAHVQMDQTDGLDIKFANGAYLSIDELIAPSGKTMSAESYLRGRK